MRLVSLTRFMLRKIGLEKHSVALPPKLIRANMSFLGYFKQLKSKFFL